MTETTEPLEDKVEELKSYLQETHTAANLYIEGYKPYRQTFRKEIVPGIHICYRKQETTNQYEFAAIMKGGT